MAGALKQEHKAVAQLCRVDKNAGTREATIGTTY